MSCHVMSCHVMSCDVMWLHLLPFTWCHRIFAVTLQHTAAHCITLHHCNIIQRTATADGHNSWSTLFLGLLLSYFNIILHTTTYYNAATHRNTLQNLMAITVNGILLLDYRQDIATHRNILHHCNTPQHTAKPDGHNSWWNLVSWLSPPLLLLVPLPLHCDMTHSHVWRE